MIGKTHFASAMGKGITISYIPPITQKAAIPPLIHFLNRLLDQASMDRNPPQANRMLKKKFIAYRAQVIGS